MTIVELIFIEEYVVIGLKDCQISERLQGRHEAVYRVIRQLKTGKRRLKKF